MKFLSVREMRGQSAGIWKDLAAEGEMVVTRNGRPIALLASLDDRSVESTLAAWRQTLATRAVAAIQRDSVRKGTDRIGMDEIEAEIAKVRRARRNRSA